ncbi:TlpA family protein disulfide reductase [Oceanithermus sp.]
MKRLLLVLAFLVPLAFAAGPVGKPAPSFSGKTIDGQPFDLRQYLGKKPIALHFWGSNCPPCRVEAPYWAQAQKAYGDQIAIIGVDVQDINVLAQDFVYTYGWTFPVVADALGSVAAAYRVTMKPTTVYIGIDGTIIGYHPGAYRRAADFENDLLRAISWRP